MNSGTTDAITRSASVRGNRRSHPTRAQTALAPQVVPQENDNTMRKSITMLMAMLVAVGMLASFAGPVAADHSYDAEAENDADIDNEIDQDQSVEQDNEQNGAAVALGDGDAEVDQDSTQDADQDQTAVNDNDVDQDAIAAAFSVF